jgi:anti-sigma B factor antagonist
MSLRLETTRFAPDIVVVWLFGSLITGSEGHALELLVDDLVERRAKKLILELSGVEEIDSTGIQYLIQCFFTMRRAEGELRLASASPKVARLFSTTGLPSYPTVHAASEGFELKKHA